jgi:hypothetical protein
MRAVADDLMGWFVQGGPLYRELHSAVNDLGDVAREARAEGLGDGVDFRSPWEPLPADFRALVAQLTEIAVNPRGLEPAAPLLDHARMFEPIYRVLADLEAIYLVGAEHYPPPR